MRLMRRAPSRERGASRAHAFAQYTQAALWSVLATALLGDGERAFELFPMLNPLTRAGTSEGATGYAVEPYVAAADLRGRRVDVGRGGWTWYTGSECWIYRVALEILVGFTKRGDTLSFAPVLPRDWPECAIDYRFGDTHYQIRMVRPGALAAAGVEVALDGRRQDGHELTLTDDGTTHVVEV